MPHPNRGDIIKLDFFDSQGHEQAGFRPALVISPSEYNRRSGMSIVCSITNQKKSTPFEVDLPLGLTTTGVVIINHIYNIDWYERNARIVERVPDPVLDEVGALIKTFLSL
jgi:mRNA interferase MazF